ncbi:hypothetical protein ODJ79_24325 [Actinoplanes sp. KI2]|uniref:hypothetical protein n=1 Tax=Actinoplanes sp. KI2 TaxID=2983315 RepID=UPI0021D59B22|nr:hypothetical protein [Actinoplanes sp. KI2]MCU7726867.1 hypothetical protein [Actinoplanes sp. KI2]
MLLVPKQLLRSGMTGNVPYYGGRFTPAQAWAASQPTGAPKTPPAGPAVGARPPASEVRAALDHLHESGVLTTTEYDELLSRISR